MMTLDTNLKKQIMKIFRYDMIIAIQYLSELNFLLHHEKKMTPGAARKNFLNSKW